MITYGSICSGVSSESVAWAPLGWIPKWFAEIDPFCCRLLRYRYPAVKNLGDITKIDLDTLPMVDLVAGGTPCQSFSLNNTQAISRGMDDDRGQLSLRFMEIVGYIEPRWVVWENVPNVLSMDGGRAFGSIVGELAQRGYGYAWRVIDLRGFGVPQRRCRLFLVGFRGGCEPAARALFDRVQLTEDQGPTRETRQEYLARVKRLRQPTIDGWTGDETPKRSKNSIPTLRRSQGGEGVGIILGPGKLRRLTMNEWERLQGFPIGYTEIPTSRKPPSDKMRQQAIGNSFPPPILAWLGRRIDLLDKEYA